MASVLAASSDVVLVLDAEGLILDFSLQSEDMERDLGSTRDWIGRPWIDTVTVESRQKVKEFLSGPLSKSAARWRHINHPSKSGPDVPLLYSVVRVAEDGSLVAVARDLRPLAELQQRLVDAQQSIERDYTKLHHAETRYRLLFQMTSEAVVIIDANSQKVLEANPAAVRMLGEAGRLIVGQALGQGFDAEGARALHTMLWTVRSTGRADGIKLQLAEGGQEVQVGATLFRHDNVSLILVRMALEGAAQTEPGNQVRSQALDVIGRLPDGFVVTDADGRILTANRTFVEMTQLATEDQLRGEPVERWLGRPGVDVSILLSNLRQNGTVRLFSTLVRGEHGTSIQVELSAVFVKDREHSCYGISVRNIERRLSPVARSQRELPRSVEQLTELVGHVHLKDLVRETTDIIERLCIEAALNITRDNRASAAEILGLSRQSLYVKLRRYGLDDAEADSDERVL